MIDPPRRPRYNIATVPDRHFLQFFFLTKFFLIFFFSLPYADGNRIAADVPRGERTVAAAGHAQLPGQPRPHVQTVAVQRRGGLGAVGDQHHRVRRLRNHRCITTHRNTRCIIIIIIISLLLLSLCFVHRNRNRYVDVDAFETNANDKTSKTIGRYRGGGRRGVPQAVRSRRRRVRIYNIYIFF